MDEMDMKILQTMQNSPDAAIIEIADTVGLSHTPCWRRIKKLEARGVIRGRAVLLDAEQLGLTISVFAELRLKEHDEKTLNALERRAIDQPEIVECFSMSGERDFLIRVVVRSVADYEIFLKKVLLHLPGVASINSSFALKCVKMTTDLPV